MKSRSSYLRFLVLFASRHQRRRALASISPSPPPCANPNTSVDLAVGKPAQASSGNAGLAVDGDGTTRWESAWGDPEWWWVDLGAPQPLCAVAISWEAAYSSAYELQTSDDAVTWTPVLAGGASGSGETTHELPGGVTARYLRFYGTERGTAWGHSFWTLSVWAPAVLDVANASPWWSTYGSNASAAAHGLVAAMTRDEKLTIIEGDPAAWQYDGYDLAYGYYVGSIPAIERLGVPAQTSHDAQSGFRTVDADVVGTSLAWPTMATLAATWDRALAERMGGALGRAFRAKGAGLC